MNDNPQPVQETPLAQLTYSDRLRAIGDAWSMAELERRRESYVSYDE